MSEEERPVQPEEEPVEESVPEASAEEPVPAEDPIPEAADPEARAIASAESQPQDQPQQIRGRSSEEKSAPSRKKGRRPHPLWRGFWLAVILLGIFVLMGREPAPGLAWVRQPLRAFAGAVLVGGCAASLPGILKGSKPAAPSWKRCVLALLCGLAWGVFG